MARTSGGFTLIEMLVALAVFGVLAGLTSTMVMQSLSASGTTRARESALRQLLVTRQLLKSDIAQAAPSPRGDMTMAGDEIATDGRMLRLYTYNSLSPDGHAAGMWVTYRWVDGTLWREVSSPAESAEEIVEAGRPLLTGVEAFELAFFAGGQWQSEGIATAPGVASALPMLIAVDMQVQGLGHLHQLFATAAGGI
ncbi:MAG: prepilin-type N-terminal cleavage/methylation domain-containing protein [Gammaproteobacteria bacterium]|nr:prepilin-type N-terminal cleavage/methylation domain-containing protein [Gammaproteobacteria bacterium]